MDHNSSRAQIVVAALDSRSRARLTAALRSDPALQIVGHVSDEADLLSLAHQPRPDILLLESALAKRINGAASSWFSTRIILLADAIGRDQVVQALHLGARGILLAASPPQTLLQSIRTVLADEYWLDADSIAMLFAITRQLVIGRPEPLRNDQHGLTQRELHIVAMIAGGCSNKQIGQTLFISERTVKHHLTHVFEKLGVSSRLQLANFVATHGLVTDLDCPTRYSSAPAHSGLRGGATIGACGTRTT